MGYYLVGSLVLGLLIGLTLDEARGTSPFWTIVVSLIFLVAGFYLVVKDSFK